MKKRLIAILGSALLVAACSDGGGSSEPAINPLAKPSRPAPRDFIISKFSAIKESKSVIPDEAALFSAIADGTDVNYIDADSSKRKEALNKLSASGRQYLQDIKDSCTLNSATKTKTGGSPAKGAHIVESVKLSSVGKNCALLIDQSIQTNASYSEYEVDQMARFVRVNMTVSTVNKNRQEVKGASNIAQSKVQLMDTVMTTDISVSMNFVNGKGTMNVRGAVGGQMTLKFADGETLQGPVKGFMEASSNGDDTKLTNGSGAIRMELSSSAGDIWITMAVVDGKSETYLNGEKINPSDLGGFVINNESVK